MWFLKFWVLSSIICFIIMWIVTLATMSKFKRIYRYQDKEISFIEFAPVLIQSLVLACVPIMNIIFTLILLFYDNTEVLQKISKDTNAVLKNEGEN